MIHLLQMIFNCFRISVFICTLFVPVTLTGQTSKPSYTPPRGMVPDKATALRIAKVILTPIYGKTAVESQKPFSVHLNKGIWVIEGKIAKGQLTIEISKKNGCILRVIGAE
jgi:hypothetical protein